MCFGCGVGGLFSGYFADVLSAGSWCCFSSLILHIIENLHISLSKVRHKLAIPWNGRIVPILGLILLEF